MKLTIEQIERGLTLNGGFRLVQLMALGYRPDRPGKWPAKGWKERLTQREVSEAQYQEFLRLATADRKKDKQVAREHQMESSQPKLL